MSNTIKWSNQDKILSKFVMDLRSKVNALFVDPDTKAKRLSKKGDWRMYGKSAVIGLLFLSAYALLFIIMRTFGAAAAIYGDYCYLGLTLALIGFCIMHDANHEAYSENERVNDALGYTMNLLGSFKFGWKEKHYRHHLNTNLLDHEEDTDLYPLLRIDKSKQFLWFHKYQHIYAWPLYFLAGFVLLHYNDIVRYRSRKIADHPFDFPKRERLIFWISKFLHFLLFWVIPGAYFALVKEETTSLGQAAWFGFKVASIGYVIMVNLVGFIMSVIFQLSHVVTTTTMFALEGVEISDDVTEFTVPYQWYVHQLLSTTDFAPESRFWGWCLGGLNRQTIHHWFQGICHVHYREIQKIFISEFRKFEAEHSEYGVLYKVFPTFLSAVRDHWLLLYNLGRA